MIRAPKTSPPGTPRLFSDSHPASPPAGVHIANIDGASRGNPGPASYAVVVRDPAGKKVLELAKNIGRETNNVAEYYSLLAALDYATSQGISALRIRSDSELLVRQMQGRYKVKSPDLKPLFERASKMARQLKYFAIEHVRRELNTDADALANVALDSAGVAKYDGRSSKIEALPHDSAQKSLTGATPTRTAPIVTHPPGAATRTAPSAGQSPRISRSIPAVFSQGVFVPSERPDLAEGTEVILEVRIPTKE